MKLTHRIRLFLLLREADALRRKAYRLRAQSRRPAQDKSFHDGNRAATMRHSVHPALRETIQK
jgi:hypothetical protein